QRLVHLLIQLDCRSQIRAERLFEHNAPPAAIFSELAGFAQVVDDGREQGRGESHVKEAVCLSVLETGKMFGQFFEIIQLGVLPADIMQVGSKDIPLLISEFEVAMLLHAGQQMFAKLLVGKCRAAKPDDLELLGCASLAK